MSHRLCYSNDHWGREITETQGELITNLSFGFFWMIYHNALSLFFFL